MKRVSVESVLVMFLFILFTASIGMLIVEGQGSYSRIIKEKEETENIRIGISYISKRMKQNDFAGNIQVVSQDYNDGNAISIDLMAEDEGYVTYILCQEDGLYEIYQDLGAPIDIEYGEKIVDLPALWSFEYDQDHSLINILEGDKLLGAVYIRKGVVTSD